MHSLRPRLVAALLLAAFAASFVVAPIPLRAQADPAASLLVAMRADQLRLDDLGPGWAAWVDPSQEAENADGAISIQGYQSMDPNGVTISGGLLSMIVVPRSDDPVTASDVAELIDTYNPSQRQTSAATIAGAPIGNGTQWRYDTYTNSNGVNGEEYVVGFSVGGALALLNMSNRAGAIGPDDLVPLANLVASRLAANPPLPAS